MRKALLLTLFATVSFYVHSQTNFRFADSTAQWSILEAGTSFWCTGNGFPCYYYQTEEFRIIKDTSLLGYDYQVLNNHARLRKDSAGRVFIRELSDTADRLLYDFSKQVGDTFDVTFLDGVNVVCAIDSVDTVNWDKPRKRMFVSYVGGWRGDQWVEGIGSLHTHFLRPGFEAYLFDGSSFSVLCFSEQGNLIIHPDTFFQTCIVDTIIYLGLHEVRSTSLISISPNPATNNVTITTDESMVGGTVSVCDVTGREILIMNIEHRTLNIEVEDFAAGVYFVSVTSTDGKSAAKKLVVSK